MERTWLESQAYTLWKFNNGDANREWEWLSEGEKALWADRVREEVRQIVRGTAEVSRPRHNAMNLLDQ